MTCVGNFQQRDGFEMTPEESRMLKELYDIVTRVETATGKTFDKVIAEQYDVLAANYVENGEKIGRTTADTEAKVDRMIGQLNQLAAAVNRLEGGGTEG